MIPDEAVEAAAFELYKDDHWGRPAEWPTGPFADEQTLDEFKSDYLKLARAALEAAAPHMLENMRPMTLVEIANRDRPESMEAARAKVRADRCESQAELLRAAREVAWAKGATSAGLNLVALQAAGINPNPYRAAE